MRAIRRDLILTILAALFVLYGGAAVLFYLSVERSLVGEMDGHLAREARNLAEMCQVESEAGGRQIEIEFEDLALPEYEASQGGAYYQLWASDGTVLARSASLGAAQLPRDGGSETGIRIRDISLPDETRGRACALRFAPRAEEGSSIPAYGPDTLEELLLVVARSREELDHTLGVLGTGLVSAGVLLLAGTTLVVTWRVRKALAPLDRIGRKTEELGPHDLGYRFPTDHMPEELQPICTRLNELFARLEAAFERERTFSANVAHELRTPIAELRALSEVGLKRSPATATEDDPARYFEDALAIAKQMESQVTTLLDLVRCESGQRSVKAGSVDLARLVRSTWGEYAAEAEGKGLECRMDLPESLVTLTDEEMVRSILRNLLSNAVDHTHAGGSIQCRLLPENGGFRLEVENCGTDLEGEDLGHLAEPFWRKDASRTGGAHAGLGLSLVTAYSRLLGFAFRVSLPHRGTLRAELRSEGEPKPAGPRL